MHSAKMLWTLPKTSLDKNICICKRQSHYMTKVKTKRWEYLFHIGIVYKRLVNHLVMIPICRPMLLIEGHTKRINLELYLR